jgi:hypothetical protein
MSFLNCFEAISLADSREVFYMEDDFIKPYNSDKCLGVSKQNIIVVSECTAESKFVVTEK